ncbi:MAG: PCRF domain-containing protein [Mariniblastus sp.]
MSCFLKGSLKWLENKGAKPLLRVPQKILRSFQPLPKTCWLVFSEQLNGATEVVLELKSGEGGDDSKLFVHDLFSALSKYLIAHQLIIDEMSVEPGQVVAVVRGKHVWKILGSEVGCHCVQRIPPTETKGRRHTSYLSVAVFPIVESAGSALDLSEVEIKTQGGHGPGGQHQNRRDSAVRITHRPTGIQVFINGRSQHANRREGLRVLTARVNDHLCQQTNESYQDVRKSLLGNRGRGNKIRTYNFIDDRAVDHRTGKKASAKKVLSRGCFDLLS